MSAGPSAPSGARRPVLLYRPECHLCDVLADELTARGVAFDTAIVDHHPAWRARFGDAIPVLLDAAMDEPVQETFFDEARLASWRRARA